MSEAGTGYPSGPYDRPGPQVLVSMGDISVTPTHVVTPAGSCPVQGSVWTAQDHVVTTSQIPGWAVVMTVLFVWFCLIGLLFLLAKKITVSGWVEVAVQGQGLYYATRVSVVGSYQIAAVHDQVNYARTLAASGAAPASGPGVSTPFAPPAAWPTPTPGAIPDPLTGSTPPGAAPSSAGSTGSEAPSVRFNDSRSHWFDGSAWRDARVEIPPGAMVDTDRQVWFDGTAWRPLP